jgi:hypothetical protein
MPKRATGRYERTTVGGEAVAAFVPHALTPADPPIVVDAALAERLRAAEQALVRLGLAGEMVPSLDWFIYAFVRKEAVLSSQIEGTQATLAAARHKTSGYSRRSLVENVNYRYKAILGRGMRARSLAGQQLEARLGCRILNVMAQLGMPDSVDADHSDGRVRSLSRAMHQRR